ncbi:hypothetical protein M378DRAFT_172157 [Amanita muscaria Koide BX008]|uniref:Uncharacterized protein n=1 Tax=Amanita muscaria (strain Koide BX008) TaxID=946122 RepID=A0A0C2WLN9_AMAMK|nr:hypothetical protein M378DRAFT_172157 [Amanita muscaria Koide BX008]
MSPPRHVILIVEVLIEQRFSSQKWLRCHGVSVGPDSIRGYFVPNTILLSLEHSSDLGFKPTRQARRPQLEVMPASSADETREAHETSKANDDDERRPKAM